MAYTRNIHFVTSQPGVIYINNADSENLGTPYKQGALWPDFNTVPGNIAIHPSATDKQPVLSSTAPDELICYIDGIDQECTTIDAIKSFCASYMFIAATSTFSGTISGFATDTGQATTNTKLDSVISNTSTTISALSAIDDDINAINALVTAGNDTLTNIYNDMEALCTMTAEIDGRLDTANSHLNSIDTSLGNSNDKLDTIITYTNSTVVNLAGLTRHSKSVSVTPNINTAPYSTGYVIGGKMTFTSVLTSVDFTSITGIRVMDTAKQNAQLTIYVFNQNPAGTYTNGSAFTLNNTDKTYLAKIITIQAAEYISVDATTSAVEKEFNQGIISMGGSRTNHLYAVAVVTGTPTYTGTSSLTFTLTTLTN